MSTIFVTGAAGNVGQEVVRALLARRATVVAADHKTERVSALFGGTVVTSRLDFNDRATWASAFHGAEHMFLMRPPAIADVENNLNPFIDFARSKGVDHVVFLSVAGAGQNKLVPHRKVEDHLRARGDHHTNLRPGFFAQNLQSAYRTDIVEDDRIYVPAGRKPVNWVDVRDIAEVAALVQTILHFLLRFGQGGTVDPTLERLLGRPGRSVQQYIADHAALWEGTLSTTREGARR